MNEAPKPNVTQAVPFFGISNMDASLRFYIDGLNFKMTNKWINQGKLNWCWLQLGNAAIMLQEFRKSARRQTRRRRQYLLPMRRRASDLSRCQSARPAHANSIRWKQYVGHRPERSGRFTIYPSKAPQTFPKRPSSLKLSESVSHPPALCCHP